MSLALLNEKRTKRKTLCDEAGKILSDAAKAARAMTSDEMTRWKSIHATAQEILEKEIQPLQHQLEVEADLRTVQENDERRSAGRETTEEGNTPLDGASGKAPTKEERAEAVAKERRMFRGWMLQGDQGLEPEERKLLQVRREIRRKNDLLSLESMRAVMGEDSYDLQRRALAAGTNSAGGYTVPQDFEYKLDVALKAYGGMFATSEIIPTTDGRLLPYPNVNDTQNTGEITAENAAVGGSGISGAPAENDPTFGVVNFSAWMFDSGVVLLPVQLIEDGAFDIEKMLIDLLKIRIGRKANNILTVNGTGSGQPTAIISAATLGVTTTTSVTISYNNLIDLEHSVDPLYRVNNADNGPGYMFADSTLQAIKKLVDSSSRPLFIAGGVSEGIQNKSPDTINGIPFTINQDMPSINAANKSILYGGLKKYKIRKVREVQLVRFGERYMTNLQIGFLAFIRLDGNLVDAGTHPVKYLQQSQT